MAPWARHRTPCNIPLIRYRSSCVRVHTIARAVYYPRAVHTWDNFGRKTPRRVYNEKRDTVWTVSHIQLHHHMARITLRNRQLSRLRAFTLVELVVVTGIIVVVTSVVLVNNNRFGGVVQLENLAYDVALSVRQAQVYGISVQRYGAAGFLSGYGMHFDINDPQHYEFFADVDKDGFFDSPGENVSPSPYTIRSGFRISGLCAPQGTNAATCTGVSSASQIDITFKRPEADAWISASGIGCAYGVGTCAESARIILLSPRGDVMSIIVGANGQISVQREASQ